uniref:Uncharacterized protein n=1 Tax=Steinernema glaseri TaxID=37863 RepID=A0A1I7ZZM9_9BILA
MSLLALQGRPALTRVVHVHYRLVHAVMIQPEDYIKNSVTGSVGDRGLWGRFFLADLLSVVFGISISYKSR